MFLRTLPVGFMASLLTAALLLSMSDLAIAQRSGVRAVEGLPEIIASFAAAQPRLIYFIEGSFAWAP